LKQENIRYENETNNQETKVKMSCDEKQYEIDQEVLGQKSQITIKFFGSPTTEPRTTPAAKILTKFQGSRRRKSCKEYDNIKYNKKKSVHLGIYLQMDSAAF
jgi:hypothetical protein